MDEQHALREQHSVADRPEKLHHACAAGDVDTVLYCRYRPHQAPGGTYSLPLARSTGRSCLSGTLPMGMAGTAAVAAGVHLPSRQGLAEGRCGTPLCCRRMRNGALALQTAQGCCENYNAPVYAADGAGE